MGPRGEMGVNGSIGLPGLPGMQVDMVVPLCAINCSVCARVLLGSLVKWAFQASTELKDPQDLLDHRYNINLRCFIKT